MALLDLLPFRQAVPARRRAQVLNLDDQKVLAKLFRAAGLALGFTFTGRTEFQDAPYDFDRIIQAVDTDSYVRQGFAKYKELMFKEGWEIVSENPEAVAYLYQRIDFMELAMGQSFHDFLTEVADQLIKFNNAFVVKSRGDLGPFFPRRLNPAAEDALPVIGYELLPTESIQIRRDRHGKPLAYRQDLDGYITGYSNADPPTWPADQVIHFYLDKKPKRGWGTPFMVTVLDDVVALRQMEEDIQNLVHRELFPLYKYKVGTETHPADDGEIDAAVRELENLRSEGGLVLPERHDVEVVGAENNALDATGYLQHFKERVCVGMGMSPHHLGMLMNGGNRSVTDRLDVALYDKIKTVQRYFARMIELKIFAEILIEGGYDPMETPIAQGVSDRCLFKFREIDVDTQVKRETHAIQKFAQNVATLPETRLALGMDPEAEEEDLMMGMQTRLQPTPVKPATDGKMPEPIKPDAKSPSTGGRPNKPNTAKGVGNIIRPSNQFGRRTSPDIRRSDLNGALDYLVELIGED